MIIYPCVRIAENLKRDAVPGTLFACWWVNQELYLDWFKLFSDSIPAARPVLLIQDGHFPHQLGGYKACTRK